MHCAATAAAGLDRAESTRVHKITSPLSSDFPEQDLQNVQLVEKPKLMFICLNRAEHLLQDSARSASRLKSLFYHLCKTQLHPKGTVIVSTPAPFHAYATPIAGMSAAEHGELGHAEYFALQHGGVTTICLAEASNKSLQKVSDVLVL